MKTWAKCLLGALGLAGLVGMTAWLWPVAKERHALLGRLEMIAEIGSKMEAESADMSDSEAARFAAYFAPDCSIHLPGSTLTGRDTVRRFFADLRRRVDIMRLTVWGIRIAVSEDDMTASMECWSRGQFWYGEDKESFREPISIRWIKLHGEWHIYEIGARKDAE